MPPTEVTMSCLIASSPRTGSNLLSECLRATGVAGNPQESFQPQAYERFRQARGRPANFRDYAEDVLVRSTTGNGVLSTTMKWNGLRWLLALIRSLDADAAGSDLDVVAHVLPHPRYVFLHRSDTARQAISWYRAIKTDVWRRRADHPVGPDLPQGFVPNYPQIRWLEELANDHDKRWREFFASHDVSPLELRYEDIENDVASSVRQVLDYLEIDPPATAIDDPSLHRQADERTDAWLETYLARRDELPASPWSTTGEPDRSA